MDEKNVKKIEPYKIFLSAFGMGFMPFAPGTWGSVWTALIAFVIAIVFKSNMITAISLAVLFVYGFWATIYFGDEGIKNYGDDPGMIVSDEVCGQAIALFWLLQWETMSNVDICYYFGAGFILFRIFDIIKFWPASYFDRQKTKWGVLLDDIVAGVYAGVILQAGRILLGN